MKKLMKKINWKMVIAILFIAVSTHVGIYFMEEEFCEWMSGVMWIFGEMMIVGLIFTRDLFRWLKEWIEELNNM